MLASRGERYRWRGRAQCGETNADFAYFCATCSSSRKRPEANSTASPRDGSPSTDRSHSSTARERSLGSWTCSKCGETNFSYTHFCVSCSTSRAPHKTQTSRPGTDPHSSAGQNKGALPRFVIICPGCTHKLNLASSVTGQIRKCPTCKVNFTVEIDPSGRLHSRILQASDTSSREVRGNGWNQILNVPEDATLEEIRTAYRNLIRQYHPDKVANLGTKLQELAEEETKMVNGAFEHAMQLRSIG